MIPEQISRYHILEPLGKGAIGEVYRALDPDLKREVAIKIIPRRIALGSTEIQKRFQREVQLATHLNHPHIVFVYDVGIIHRDVKPGKFMLRTTQFGPLSQSILA